METNESPTIGICKKCFLIKLFERDGLCADCADHYEEKLTSKRVQDFLTWYDEHGGAD